MAGCSDQGSEIGYVQGSRSKFSWSPKSESRTQTVTRVKDQGSVSSQGTGLVSFFSSEGPSGQVGSGLL